MFVEISSSFDAVVLALKSIHSALAQRRSTGTLNQMIIFEVEFIIVCHLLPGLLDSGVRVTAGIRFRLYCSAVGFG